MKQDEVPQDESRTLAGNRKLLYATSETGEYSGVKSAGWEAEDFATLSAVEEIYRLRNEALARARAGLCSPLEFHMYDRRMEPATLSQTTGLPGWRIRRHFRPAVFARLSDRLMTRYSEALGLTPQQIRLLPSGDEG